MNNEPDYFAPAPGGTTRAVMFVERADGEGEDGWYERFIDVTAETDTPPLTATDVAHAIAGIIQLYEHPTEDLHGYTKYVPLAESFVRSLGNKAPAVDVAAVQSDPLAGLGI